MPRKTSPDPDFVIDGLSAARRRQQLQALNSLLAEILPRNPFYAAKLKHLLPFRPFGDLKTALREIPFTTKEELQKDHLRQPPHGTHLSYPMGDYIRSHQTSGSFGEPMVWLDRAADWEWVVENWKCVLKRAGVRRSDVVYFAFSFGPFLGFWAGFDAACALGCLCIPGGGLDSVARLHQMSRSRASVLCCTPTYALRLGDTLKEMPRPRPPLIIQKLLLAGEPGASIPQIRSLLEKRWPGVAIVDHHGMTEVGAVTVSSTKVPLVLQVLEKSYIAEVIDSSAAPVGKGGEGELVLTTLGRPGNPLLRYRTGDLVRPLARDTKRYGSADLPLEGGILGRIDDMLVVRGINFYPSAVDRIILGHSSVREYRLRIHENRRMLKLDLTVEFIPVCRDPMRAKNRLMEKLQKAFPLKFDCRVVKPGHLSRFEMKARRWTIE